MDDVGERYQFNLKKIIKQIDDDIVKLENEELNMKSMKTNLTDKVLDLIKRKTALIKLHGRNFSVRLSKPYMPIVKAQDREFPPKDRRSLDNFLTGVLDNDASEFNFAFQKGDVSQIESYELNSKKIQSKNSEISSVVLKFNDSDGLVAMI